jgi:Domain of unknown function (DUF1844)
VTEHDDAETADTPLPGGEGESPIDFTTFILSMSTSCMIQLGELADPDTAIVTTDLAHARQTLEILALLERKTEGNLSGEEDRMLAHVLEDLRARYLAKFRR